MCQTENVERKKLPQQCKAETLTAKNATTKSWHETASKYNPSYPFDGCTTKTNKIHYFLISSTCDINLN